MSYLHTKKILHKDLRSKNIFIESKNKVVITDFGLFSMKRLRHSNRCAVSAMTSSAWNEISNAFARKWNAHSRNNTMVVPVHWLSYLAPELVRALSEDWRELPFSESSDVFAFRLVIFNIGEHNLCSPIAFH